MSKYLFFGIFSIITQLSFGATTPWDCSKITLKEYKFGRDCARIGTTLAADKRRKDIYENRNCTVTVDIAGEQKKLNFLVPSPHWRDDIGFSWQCENSQGNSYKQLPKNCSISINQGDEENPGRTSCECTNIGCGQALAKVNGVETNQVKEELKSAFKSLSPECDDLVFGGSSKASGETEIYLSSLKCPISRYGDRSCPQNTNARNLSYHNAKVASVCVPALKSNPGTSSKSSNVTK